MLFVRLQQPFDEAAYPEADRIGCGQVVFGLGRCQHRAGLGLSQAGGVDADAGAAGPMEQPGG